MPSQKQQPRPKQYLDINALAHASAIGRLSPAGVARVLWEAMDAEALPSVRAGKPEPMETRRKHWFRIFDLDEKKYPQPECGKLSRLIEGLDEPVGFDLSRKEVLAMKIPPKVWIAAQGKKGLFRRPDLSHFHGPPFSGKTELMKALAIPLTQGGDFFGYEVTEPGGIFWAHLDTELDDAQAMYQAWPKKVGERIHVTDVHPADLQGGFEEWLDHLRRSHDKRKWPFCIIDTMAQLIRKGPRGQSIDVFKRDQVTDFLTPLRRALNERRIMSIILDHPRKPQMGDIIELPSTGAYGSVAFSAMADLTMRLRRYANGDAILDWQGRGRPNGQINLRWSDAECRFLPAGHIIVGDLSAGQLRIVETLEQSKEGLKQAQIVRATKLYQGDVSEALDDLWRKGRIERIGEGRSPLWKIPGK